MIERLATIRTQTPDEAILDHHIRGAEIDSRLISADEKLGQEIAAGHLSQETLTILGETYGEQLQAAVDGPKMQRELVLFNGKIELSLPAKAM